MQQGSLFDLLVNAPGTTACLAGVMPAVRAAMNRVAGESIEGRKLLVESIKAVAVREGMPLTASGAKSITLEILNKWVQPKDSGHEPPLLGILCFCLAAKDFTPLLPILAVSGLAVVPKEKMKFLDYGESCWRIKEEKQRQKKLEAGL